ncbi:MAG: VOC family protein, partial [Desulfobacterales bacterium]|nr:VOC family protein [Desulfobacterales bacterium]
WLNARPDMPALPSDNGCHIGLRTRTEVSVRAFHKAALAGGGSDEGEPGPRQAAMTTYYGAFILDPDGNKIEAVCFPA